MSSQILLHRPDIQDGHLSLADSLQKHIPIYRLHPLSSLQETPLDLFDLSKLPLRKLSLCEAS